ncbi:aprataxin and PNK-like factor isoform X2 [Spodoptera litura]|uniref:Aprataxin and PNK-like factor isoform X2 n=1 Tax=Spodoptera litura TaxID=69820 RepID=A0A9J7EFX8_SPOLT|nr:aprataxin and PNK-like factor isoform X2 [Spodoptera litura]
MIFKVVRTDTDNNYKIKLPFGVFTIGRSHFKIEEDLRISRNHAQLEVTATTLTLKSLHKNPCFYIKEGKEIHVLKQDCSVELTHGNKFGLLPEVFWYEVQQLPDEDSNESDKDETVLVPNGTSTDNEVRTSISEDNDPQSNQHTDTAPNKTDINGISPQVPLVDNAVTPTKRNNTSMDTSPVDVKKVKTEPVDSSIVKTEPMDTSNVQVEPAVQNADVTSGNATVKVEPTESSNARVDPNTGNAASPSDVQPGTSNNDQSGNNAAPTSPVKPTVRLRERCFYGANCYRRNPQHREDFCHPNDSDWGSGEQTACPYGSGCGRRDPRHWRLHSHPAGAAPPAPRPHPPGMRRVERHGNIYYINAHTVNFYDDHFETEDSDGDSVDYDYEF